MINLKKRSQLTVTVTGRDGLLLHTMFVKSPKGILTVVGTMARFLRFDGTLTDTASPVNFLIRKESLISTLEKTGTIAVSLVWKTIKKMQDV